MVNLVRRSSVYSGIRRGSSHGGGSKRMNSEELVLIDVVIGRVTRKDWCWLTLLLG